MAEMFRPLREFATAAIQRVAESDPSPGYEPMLVKRGVDPIVARMTARLLVSKGTRIAREREWRPRVNKAIGFIASPGRRRSAIVKKAQVLLEACEKTSVVQTIFCTAGLNESEFMEALKSAAEGDEIACRHAAQIAALIAPDLLVARGPKVSAASAAHESLLEDFNEMTGSRSYTYSDDKEDYVDSLTEATRLEFGNPDFDPRPAHRRLKRKRNSQ
jgi:hypothetical protein